MDDFYIYGRRKRRQLQRRGNRRRGEGTALLCSNIVLALLLMLLFISAAVTITLHFRPLYYFDINHLHIAESSGFDVQDIRSNYDTLIDYNSFFGPDELRFPTLPMSEGGRIHFEEVKVLFLAFEKMLIVNLLLCIGLIIFHVKNDSFRFLKLAGGLTVVIPLVLGGLIALNWDWCFVTFHHIAFDNDYWIFDEMTDPVIKMLPDTFFLHCALMILGITVLCAVVSLILGIWMDNRD